MKKKPRHVQGNVNGYRDFEILKVENGISRFSFSLTTK